MSALHPRRSATILPFKAPARRAGSESRKPAEAAPEPAGPAIQWGSSWYHDAAIREDADRKR